MKGKSEGPLPVPIELADKSKGGRTFWQQIAQDDPDGNGTEKFATVMKKLGPMLFGGDYKVCLHAFDWDKFEKGTVLDVGGSNGHIEVVLAKGLPDMSFVIQDLEQNAERANENIKQNDLQDRVRFQTHDFFQPQPNDLKPSAYLLSRILHDWQDDDCIRILKNLLPAMRNHGTKLLIIDRVMPDNIGETSRYKELPNRSMDMMMYMFYASKERSLADFRKLLKQVDQSLEIVKSVQPANSVFAFLEVNYIS